MDFTPYDRDSVTWQKLRAFYTERLRLLRQRNDHFMSESERNILIGQIQEVKALLALEAEPIIMPNTSEGGI